MKKKLTKNKVYFKTVLVLLLFVIAFNAEGQNVTFPDSDTEKDNWTITPSADGKSTILQYNGNKRVKSVKIIYKNAFSVSATKIVKFSSGNLQYNTATNKFQFAEHQWDIVGSSGANNSTSGIRDLFGWGTWLEGGNPMNNSKNDSEYSWDYTKSSAIGSEWVALTLEEWIYLQNRSEGKKIGVAKVNGVQGLVILPDYWILPDGITFNNGFAANSGSAYYETINKYTAADWYKMESAGAVFLPAAGYHDVDNFYSSVFDEYYSGNYWLADDPEDSEIMGLYIGFYSESISGSFGGRSRGRSVRLVRIVRN